MKKLFYTVVAITPLLMLPGCLKQRFLPDPFNPGLSRLTDKQVMTGTCYINDVAYINYWPGNGFSLGPSPFPRLSRVYTPNAPDSVDFAWPLRLSGDDDLVMGEYDNITIRMPAPQGAPSETLKQWNGKRFSHHECRIFLDYQLQGTANIYFVRITPHNSSTDYVNITGLFDGNIGDSILVKKGRFDYVVDIGGL